MCFFGDAPGNANLPIGGVLYPLSAVTFTLEKSASENLTTPTFG